MHAHIDEPVSTTPVDPLCFLVRGWIWLGAEQEVISAVECWTEDTCLGLTRVLFPRPDVALALALEPESRTGFEIFCHQGSITPGSPFRARLQVRRHDGTHLSVPATLVISTISRDYRRNHFGILLDQATTAVQRRENIWAVGPSQSAGSEEVARLLRRYLGPPPVRIVDIGCGLGSYGRSLLAEGHDWIGAEVNSADCAELARLGLPHRHIDGRRLPFADGAFDAALCLEVLEHVAEPRPFLAEIRRVAPRQLIVSVPNCELLGYLWDYRATPWHMLEATHTNFFTRWSLEALLREFYPRVEMRLHTPYPLATQEGTPLYYHLLAIATAPPATPAAGPTDGPPPD